MKKALIHVPHASLTIPQQYLPAFRIGPAEIRRQQLLMTDHYTNEFAESDENTLVFPISRLVCDVERFRDRSAEKMAEKGMWICYTHGAEKQRIKQFGAAHEAEILRQYYDPHHKAFTDLVRRRLDAFGTCRILDLHSFSAAPLPYEESRAAARPDICIGIDAFHTPEALAAYTKSYFTSAGFRVACNTPFAGSITPLAYYGQDRRVVSIMLEINRALYMQENSFAKSLGFSRVQGIVRQYISLLDSLNV